MSENSNHQQNMTCEPCAAKKELLASVVPKKQPNQHEKVNMTQNVLAKTVRKEQTTENSNDQNHVIQNQRIPSYSSQYDVPQNHITPTTSVDHETVPKYSIAPQQTSSTQQQLAATSPDGFDKRSNALNQNEKTPPEFNVFGNKLFYLGKPVANFCYAIDNIYCVMDEEKGEFTDTLFDVTIYVFHRHSAEAYPRKKVSKSLLEGSDITKQVPLATACGISKSELSNILFKYVSHLISEFSKHSYILYDSSGWKTTMEGQHIYVDGEKAIGHPELWFQSNSKLVLHNDNIPNLWSIFQSMRRTIKEPGKMDILLLYVLAEYLHTVYRESGKGLKHLLFLVGPRGSHKTSIALCFSQLMNKESPEFNFMASESGIQLYLRDYHDSVMLIDDLAPSSDVANKRGKEKKLEMVIRMFGDSTERKINTAFSNAKVQYSVHGGAIITGEYFYSTGSESSIARAVVIELKKNSVDLQLLTYFQKHPEFLETLIYQLLTYVSSHYEQVKAIIARTVEYWRSQIPENTFSNARFIDYYGQYMAMGYILAKFFHDRYGITEQETQAFLTELNKNIGRVLHGNDLKMQTRSPIYELLAALQYNIEAGRTIQWGENMPKNEAVIIIKDGNMFFRQTDLADFDRFYRTKMNLPASSMSSEELGKILKDHKVCRIYMEGQTQRSTKKQAPYSTIRLMCIPKGRFDETMAEYNT